VLENNMKGGIYMHGVLGKAIHVGVHSLKKSSEVKKIEKNVNDLIKKTKNNIKKN
jgi:hypothetical protein